MSISRRESLSIIAGASVASLVSPSLIYADEVAGANSKVVATEEMAGLISREIGEIRAQAKGLGLSNVDFDNLSIANGVPTYIFGGEVFHEEAPYFPITDNGKLVFWVIEDEHGVQIADGLVSELRGLSRRKPTSPSSTTGPPPTFIGKTNPRTRRWLHILNFQKGETSTRRLPRTYRPPLRPTRSQFRHLP